VKKGSSIRSNSLSNGGLQFSKEEMVGLEHPKKRALAPHLKNNPVGKQAEIFLNKVTSVQHLDSTKCEKGIDTN